MDRGIGWTGRIYLILIYSFLFFPALLVVVFSFNDSRFWAFPLRGVTMRWYEELMHRSDALAAANNSLAVALPTMIIAVLVGGAFALALHRWQFRLKGAAEALLLMPQLIPSLIWGLALLIFVSALKLPGGVPTIVLGHVLLTTPYVFLLVSARYHTLDPNLEYAARSLGASTGRIFIRIVVPHISPGLLAGGILAFAISFGDLILAFFLSGSGFNTLPVFIYSLIQIEPSPVINAVASIVFGIGVVAIVVATLIGGRDVALVREQRSR
jgi:spermidine/putrescine transport system permease protein